MDRAKQLEAILLLVLDKLEPEYSKVVVMLRKNVLESRATEAPKSCPKCAGVMKFSVVPCPERRVGGCCMVHYGFRCQSCALIVPQ